MVKDGESPNRQSLINKRISFPRSKLDWQSVAETQVPNRDKQTLCSMQGDTTGAFPMYLSLVVPARWCV